MLRCLSLAQAGIKRVIQKFKTNKENVNFYPRDFKLSQLFEIFLTILSTNSFVHGLDANI